MANAQIEQIKSRVDVAELVGGYVKLHKAGMNLKGLCPFHGEKTPSFFVSPTRQTWHCFGCNKGGDIFSFLQEIEGMEFTEALRTLAQRAGVELVRETRGEQDGRSRLFEINTLAAKFFAVQLEKSESGKKAQQYLEKRGLQKETVQSFQLGWAPEQSPGRAGEALSAFLRSRGFSSSEIKAAGLLLEDKGYGAKDRFRGRIMFPIFDGSNRIVGFTGRIFGRDEGDYDPKYFNTPETTIFEKSHILYALHAARKAIRKEGKVILVEGQMDCLMAHQVGTVNTVATSGTAFTAQHVITLSRLAETLIIAYDADAAGIEAAKRSIELGLEGGLLVRLAIVPQGKDPAELIANDPEQWKHLLVEETQPVVGFLLDRACKEYDVTTVEGKRSIAAEMLPTLAKIANSVERSEWMQQIARTLKMSPRNEEELWDELKKLSKKTVSIPAARQEKTSPSKQSSRRELLEEHLLALALARGTMTEEVDVDVIFTSQDNRALYRAVVTASGDDLSARLLSFREAAAEIAAVEQLAFMVERIIEVVYNLDEEVTTCLREIEALNLRERLDALSVELEVAERAGDTVRVRDLAEEFRKSSASLSALFPPKTLKEIVM